MTQRRDDGAARGQDFPQCARISVFVTVKCGVWAMRNRAWPDVVLFLLLSSAYYGSHYPIAASNEGSHFALTRALAEEHTCVIDTFFDYTAGVDFSYRDGRFYSDRPPGTAFLAVPFHVLGTRVAWARGADRTLMTSHAVCLLPALAGAWCVLLLIRVLLMLDLSPRSAWTVGLLYGLASMHWKFSAHLFSHVLTELCTLAAWYCLLALRSARGFRLGHAAAAAGALGFSTIVQYECIALLPFFALYVAMAWGRELIEIDGPSVRRAAVLALAFVAPVSLGLVYHGLCFGAPLSLPYHFQNPMWAHNASFAAQFGAPLKDGLHMLLLQFPGGYPFGVVALHPVLFVVPWGFYWFLRERPAAAVAQAAMLIAFVCLMGKYATAGGGSSGDPRYLFPVFPLMFVPVAYWYDRFVAARRDERIRVLWEAGFAILVFVGAFLNFVHFAEFYGHDLNFKRDITHPSLASREALEAIVGRVFVSRGTLPWLWALLAVGGGIWATVRLGATMVATTAHRSGRAAAAVATEPSDRAGSSKAPAAPRSSESKV